MKKLERLASLLLVVVMAVTLSVTAFAAEPSSSEDTGRIVINNAVDGQTYSVYRIFNLESYNQEKTAYSYTVNDPWKSWISTQTAYVTVNKEGYVTWTAGADPVEFEKLALAYAKKEKLKAELQVPAANGKAEFNDLPLGYYLVDSSMGALCSLGTTTGEVIMREKNKVPTIEKQVKEDSTGAWGTFNDAQIGQTVEFKTTIHAKPGAENYVVHDIMSDGLTLNRDSIKIEGLAANKDYIVKYDQPCTDKEGNPAINDFKIEFAEEYLKTIKSDTDIVITYSAVLNGHALIANGANINDTRLTYADEPNTTAWATTETETYQFQLVKTDVENNILDGAKFELYQDKAGTRKIDLVKTEDPAIYRIATEEEKSSSDFSSEVIEAGNVTVRGLDGDTTYWLKETDAPAGYNKLESLADVTIQDSNLNAKVSADMWKSGGVHVVNKIGKPLPTTGGMGTTVFYVIGGILVVAAVVLLVVKKRVNNAK